MYLQQFPNNHESYNDFIPKVWDPTSTTDHRGIAVTMNPKEAVNQTTEVLVHKQDRPNWYCKQFKDIYAKVVTQRLINFNSKKSIIDCHKINDQREKQLTIDRLYEHVHSILLDCTTESMLTI